MKTVRSTTDKRPGLTRTTGSKSRSCTCGQQNREPPRDDVSPGEPDHRREDVEPVGDRVEDLAELGGLVQPAGEVAVEVVADP
jgi:hypothetical protein